MPSSWNPFSLSKEDRRKALLFAAYFFLVICAFWIQKPLRTSKFVKAIGAQNVPYAKLGTAFILVPVMLVYSALSRRVKRERLAYGATALFALLCLGFWALFSRGSAPDWAHYAFYFYIDVYITVMLTMFWSLANDATPPDQARRIYGLVGAGGILGGAVGSSITGWLVGRLGTPPLLLLSFAIILAIGWLAGVAAHDAPHRKDAKEPSWKDAWHGLGLTLESSYLGAIAALVFCYEVVSNTVDYQFNVAASAAYADEKALAAFIGKLSSANITLSVAFQLLLTTFVLRRFGPRVGLLILPVFLAGGSLAFALTPLLPTIAFAFSADAVFNYSVNQSSKEALYTPTDEASKYQAKAFIDMFVFRFGKAVSAILILLFTRHLVPAGWQAHGLSWGALAVCLVWLSVAFNVGARFDQLSRHPAR